jgi:hypothetical protein
MKLVSRDCASALSSVEYKNRQLASESLPVSEEAPSSNVNCMASNIRLIRAIRGKKKRVCADTAHGT